jgi:Tfp pilus assembly protein PilF
MIPKRFIPLLFLLFCGDAGFAFGEEKALSESTYRELEGIDDLIERGSFQRALTDLNRLMPKLGARTYDRAVALQLAGHIHTAMGNRPAAIRAIKQALETGMLTESVNHELRYSMGQLLIAEGSYRKGTGYLLRWIKEERAPTAESRALLATAYYRQGNCGKAANQMEKAISSDKDKPAAWYELLLACYRKSGQSGKSIRVSRQAIRHHPHAGVFWNNLLYWYRQAEMTPESLALQELMYRRGMLNTGEKIRLARSYDRQGMPYQAADLLERELETGNIPRTDTHYRLLAHCLLRAREKERARDVLTKAVSKIPSGSLQYQLGTLLVDLEQWREARDTLESAIASGDTGTAGHTRLLLGISHYHTGNIEASGDAFRRAQADAAFRDEAQDWLDYLGKHQSGPTPEHRDQ